MINPKPEVVKSIATVSRQYPEILEWLKEWRDHELQTLPSVLQNTALAQGRCQVLSEITRLIENGFELIHKSAKPGADNKLIAFLHPKSTSGVLIEMCQEKSS